MFVQVSVELFRVNNSPVELAWEVGKHGCESKIRDFYWNRSKIS